MSFWRTIWNIGIDYIAVPLGQVTPVQPTSRAENLLSEEVRARWESEQNELKKEIVYSDSQLILDMLQCYNNKDTPGDTYYVAGVDISFVKDDDVNACAALVVLTYPELKVVYEDYKMIQLTEPYIPGFLGFREAPFIVDLFNVLHQRAPQYYPHVVMVDGNGILHPKQFGSACHIGVLLELPCIGVAKKLFHVGGLQKDENHQNKIKTLLKGGDTFPLVIDTGETLGMALRSCDGSTNPVYVSPGNHVTMETAVRLVHRCSKMRVPEPVRMADIRSREYIRDNFKPDDQTTDQDKT